MSVPGGVGPRREDHELFDELAVGWALRALEPEEETLVAAHLPECARCRGTVAETAEVMAALAAELPPAEPAERLRERLRTAVERTEQLPLPPSAEPTVPEPRPGVTAPDRPAAGFRAPVVPEPVHRGGFPTPWRRVLPSALAAAAVAAILALGTWNVVLSTARDDAQAAVAEQARMIDALLTPGRAVVAPLSADDGTPVATVVARTGQVQVVAHGLPVNDARAQTYVVWGLGGDAPVALGTFDVLRPRMDLLAVGSAATGLDDPPEYGISLEPGRQAPSAPTDVVARGEVTN
ncbi:anti-sigma factor domain-containing protein [Geodermatophilus sp. SYSU D00703]